MQYVWRLGFCALSHPITALPRSGGSIAVMLWRLRTTRADHSHFINNICVCNLTPTFPSEQILSQCWKIKYSPIQKINGRARQRICKLARRKKERWSNELKSSLLIRFLCLRGFWSLNEVVKSSIPGADKYFCFYSSKVWKTERIFVVLLIESWTTGSKTVVYNF